MLPSVRRQGHGLTQMGNSNEDVFGNTSTLEGKRKARGLVEQMAGLPLLFRAYSPSEKNRKNRAIN